MSKRMIDFNNFAGGALAEKLNNELVGVLENIADPNTDDKKIRKITLDLTFKPNANRQGAQIDIQAQSKLQPIIPVATNIMIDRDMNTGMLVAAELPNQLRGQVTMEIDADIQSNPGVIDLKAKSASK